MYKYYNPNPTGRTVGDCSIRALTKALGVDWDVAYALAVAKGFEMKDMPSSNSAWGAVLSENGFIRGGLPTQEECSCYYTAGDFCADHPNGIYVLGFGTHVATIVNGDLFDIYNSTNEIPQYFWYRKEERV